MCSSDLLFAQIEQLTARVKAQDEQIAQLTARVKELEGRLAQDSHNSSKPPSSDGLKSRNLKVCACPAGRSREGKPGIKGTRCR